jgi:hypothetical protein
MKGSARTNCFGGKQRSESLNNPLSITSGPWSFSEFHFTRAIEVWQEREAPTQDRVDALYDWCLAVTESGPSDDDTFSIPSEDESYVSYVPIAQVFVTYLAVVQDRNIFLRSIEGSA